MSYAGLKSLSLKAVQIEGFMLPWSGHDLHQSTNIADDVCMDVVSWTVEASAISFYGYEGVSPKCPLMNAENIEISGLTDQ